MNKKALIAVLAVAATRSCVAFPSCRPNRTPSSFLRSSARSAEPVIEFSDFWGNKIVTGDSEDNPDELPCSSNLDPLNGPLPPGAYRKLPRGQKPYCRTMIAVDVENPKADSEEIVQNMQRMIESGFQTFQLALPEYSSQQIWGESNIFGKLVLDTPSFVTKDCHFIVPYAIPGKDSIVTTPSLRTSVLGSLQRIGVDQLDTLQLEYTKGSPYLLDILDCLTDLQREGYVGSIVTKNMPPDLMDSAHRCGFDIDAYQVEGSLISKPNARSQSRELWLSSPLAGGFLTNRFIGTTRPPKLFELAPSELRHWRTTLKDWATAKYFPGRKPTILERWEAYQRNVVAQLEYIALKHQVSASAVALRWALQKHSIADRQVASVVTTCRLMNEGPNDPQDRAKHLRQVYQFELDEEDMEILDEINFRPKEKKSDYFEDEQLFNQEFPPSEEEPKDSSYPAIDFSNKNLWL